MKLSVYASFPLPSFVTRSGTLLRRVLPSLLVMVLLLSTGSELLAQRRCGTMSYLDRIMKKHPQMRRNMQEVDQANMRMAKASGGGIRGDITIPVVVHVVYSQSDQNISDAQILSQIRVLNEDFGRTNTDAIYTDEQWLDRAADTRIRFEMATVDPSGLPTTGITRTRTGKPAFVAGDNTVKFSRQSGIDAWPTEHYLNIWVCNLAQGVLGYAQFPGGGRAETDGVVISFQHFGDMGTVRPPFDLGRTATHEIGHWLNLRHIWGDGGCGVDDHVADTPPADRPHDGCPTFAHSCGGDAMYQNFMDYTNDACMNLFTQGQAQRMRALFAPGGYRHEMLNSPALKPTPAPIAYLSTPQNLEVIGTDDDRVQVQWQPVNGARGYVLKLRPIDSYRWIKRSFNRTYAVPTQLAACMEYEVKVAAVSGRDTSDYSAPMSFFTTGCNAPIAMANKPAPGGLTYIEESDGRARLSWDELPGAMAYKLRIKELGGKSDVKYPTYNRIGLGGFEPGKIYMYKVRAAFADMPGPYSQVFYFSYGTFSQANYRSVDAGRVGGARTGYSASRKLLAAKLPIENSVTLNVSLHARSGSSVLESWKAIRFVPGKASYLPYASHVPGRYILRFEDKEGFEFELPVVIE